MKYIEELEFGDCFLYKNELFVLTSDFRSDDKHKCVSVKDGNPRWFDNNCVVNIIELYTLDHENNIISVKIRGKQAN